MVARVSWSHETKNLGIHEIKTTMRPVQMEQDDLYILYRNIILLCLFYM